LLFDHMQVNLFCVYFPWDYSNSVMLIPHSSIKIIYIPISKFIEHV
uniref:Ovule protein n=1 Tax=Taenia asiatica TaxID=60517 RepID=A0A0R3WGU7_TAEAS